MADDATATDEAPEVATDDRREALLAVFSEHLGDAVLGSAIKPGQGLWVRVATSAWADAATVASEKAAHYQEARRWYGDFLDSFPADAESPSINYRLADLLLENKDFGEAAKQYERTAYEYEAHAQSAAAGYAGVYARREQLKTAAPDQRDGVMRETVASSLKFADTFPEHEQAPVILGAAADDLYEMKDYREAVTSARSPSPRRWGRASRSASRSARRWSMPDTSKVSRWRRRWLTATVICGSSVRSC